MLFTRALVALLPVVVAALPAPDTAPDLDVLHGEMQVFKRDSTLQARDVELADQHGVNLTESKSPRVQVLITYTSFLQDF